MSVLDSETPYREMQDKPAVSFATADSKLISSKTQYQDKPKKLRLIMEDVEKENYRFSEMI